MKKKGNAGSHLAVRQLIAFALALLTLMSCMGTAFAEETPPFQAAVTLPCTACREAARRALQKRTILRLSL